MRDHARDDRAQPTPDPRHRGRPLARAGRARRRVRLRRLAVVAAALAAAGCGGGPDPAPESPEGEGAWLQLLDARGLRPADGAFAVEVSGEEPELSVTISVPVDGPDELTFGDGLYGALAFTFDGEEWARVDTAEVRTQVAPLLAAGESAEVSLPVREADSYRVLVPADGLAAWGDAG